MIRDDRESDPRRRFKCILQGWGEYDMEGHLLRAVDKATWGRAGGGENHRVHL